MCLTVLDMAEEEEMNMRLYQQKIIFKEKWKEFQKFPK